MIARKKTGLLFTALVILVFVLAACTAEPETVEVVREVEVTRVVTETEVVEGETVEVTRVVTEVEEVVVEVTAEPEEEEAMAPAGPADPRSSARVCIIASRS